MSRKLIPKNEKAKGITVTNPRGRIIIIGDCHGCYQELIEIVEKCKITANDKIIFTGDLVDRGPESGKCVDFSMKHFSVLGNHEAWHIYYKELNTGKNLKSLLPNGRYISMTKDQARTCTQLTMNHFKYFQSLPYYIKLPEFDAAVVHAGVYPGITLKNQLKNHLLRIQMIKPFNENETPCFETRWPRKVGIDAGWHFWATKWNGPERIIFGHTVLNKPLIMEKAIGLDGGCCRGYELRALVLPEWEIVSVQSHLKADLNRKPTPIYEDIEAY